jgi:hypothetical protein
MSAGLLPPLMMAPAWPMRRPGGAVAPARKATTGFRGGHKCLGLLSTCLKASSWTRRGDKAVVCINLASGKSSLTIVAGTQ